MTSPPVPPAFAEAATRRQASPEEIDTGEGDGFVREANTSFKHSIFIIGNNVSLKLRFSLNRGCG